MDPELKPAIQNSS